MLRLGNARTIERRAAERVQTTDSELDQRTDHQSHFSAHQDIRASIIDSENRRYLVFRPKVSETGCANERSARKVQASNRVCNQRHLHMHELVKAVQSNLRRNSLSRI